MPNIWATFVKKFVSNVFKNRQIWLHCLCPFLSHTKTHTHLKLSITQVHPTRKIERVLSSLSLTLSLSFFLSFSLPLSLLIFDCTHTLSHFLIFFLGNFGRLVTTSVNKVSKFLVRNSLSVVRKIFSFWDRKIF